MEISINRRNGLKVMASGVAALVLPYQFTATAASPYLIPMVMGGVISSLVSAVASFFSENRRDSATISAEKRQQTAMLEAERTKIMMGNVNWMFGQLPLNERLALLKNGAFYNALLSDRFDEFGTILAVNNGNLHIARGLYGGRLPSDIGLTISTDIIPQTGVAPVPIDISPLEDDRTNSRVKEFLAGMEGISMRQYDEKYTPGTISRMSLARRPTASGSDFAFVSSIDRTQQVSNGSNDSTYRIVNAIVPRKVYS